MCSVNARPYQSSGKGLPRYISSHLKSNMEGLNQITRELFVSVDNACHALDELALPEGYVTTIKRQLRVGNSKDSEVKTVNLQCSCNAVHNGRLMKTVKL